MAFYITGAVLTLFSIPTLRKHCANLIGDFSAIFTVLYDTFQNKYYFLCKGIVLVLVIINVFFEVNSAFYVERINTSSLIQHLFQAAPSTRKKELLIRESGRNGDCI